MAEYEDFKAGVASLGFWEIIVSSPEAADGLLLFNYKKLDGATLKQLYQVEWSENSKRKEKEEDVIYCWELFISACEKGFALISFLYFFQKMLIIISFWINCHFFFKLNECP